VKKRQVEIMTMLNTNRSAIGLLARPSYSAFGLIAVLAFATSGISREGSAADYGLVRYQTDQNDAAALHGSRSTDSGKPGSSVAASPGHSEGEIIYEDPMAFEPFDGQGMPSPDCGYGCPPSWVLTADGIYLNRGTDSQSSLSTGFRMPDFDYDTAGRVSLSHRFDCLIGWEVAYFGPFEWTQSNQAAGAGLDSRIFAPGLNLSAFNNAVFHEQEYNSRIQSYEFSQKWWGWDVITTSAGVRFIDVEEDFFFNSTNALAETGSLEVLTNNHLFGGQLGLDLILPVGRFSTTTKFRGSIYANFIDTSILITNAGAVELDTAEDEVDFAAFLELGYYVSYYLTPHIAVRAGYESMWLYGLALAPDQLANQFSGRRQAVDTNGDVFYHGATAGVEVNW
jgi:hypothetical protein